MSANSLGNGDRVAVIGGGPAGAFTSYFLLRMAHDVGLDLQLDLFEPRQFTHSGPGGCNHCGGLVSGSLLREFAMDGILPPTSMIQGIIDSCVLHVADESVRIAAPNEEESFVSIYRGNGPSGSAALQIPGFDAYMLALSEQMGARVRRKVVGAIQRSGAGFRVTSTDLDVDEYQFVVVATGLNSHLIDELGDVIPAFRPPPRVRSHIAEFHLGRDAIARHFDSAIHVFLPPLPGLEFGVLIPKGDFVTLCLVGDLTDSTIDAFYAAPEVRECFPHGFLPPIACHCLPRVNHGTGTIPYGERILLLGDCAATRLYKDGIGSAYRMAKAAASTAIRHGVGERELADHLLPLLHLLDEDNRAGRWLFSALRAIRSRRILRSAVIRTIRLEQDRPGSSRPLSLALRDLFAGSTPFRPILRRVLDPGLLFRLCCALPFSLMKRGDRIRKYNKETNHAR